MPFCNETVIHFIVGKNVKSVNGTQRGWGQAKGGENNAWLYIPSKATVPPQSVPPLVHFSPMGSVCQASCL